MQSVASFTAYLPQTLLVASVLGWLGSLVLSRRAKISPFLGFTLIAGAILFLLRFGVWSGYASSSDMNYFAIAGRVPQSDAGAYQLGSFDVGYSGRWSVFSSNRPLAAALRDIINGLAGLSYTKAMIVQALLLAGATFLAARSVYRWLGPWSSLAFVGLALVLIRPFLGTAATENQGLMWAMLGVAFIADALRKEQFSSAALGVACMSAALTTRNGALFVLPSLMAWAFVAFADRNSWKRRAAIVLAAGAVPVLLALLLGLLYGAKGTSAGWNFAYVLCGLTTGTNWQGCVPAITNSGITPGDTTAFGAALYAMAWETFKAQPGVLFHELWLGLYSYINWGPTQMLTGYMNNPPVPPWLVQTAMLVLLPGMAVHFWRSRWSERLFWPLLFIGLAISVGFIFATDGWRVLYATHPLIALFCVLGLRSSPRSGAAALNPKYALSALSAAAAALIATPFLLHVFMATKPTDTFSSRAITGFVVIPDGAAAPKNAPYFTTSEFSKLIGLTTLENEWGKFVAPTIAQAPFSFFWTAQIFPASQMTQVYIGPLDIMERSDVSAWLFKFTEPGWKKPGQPVRVIESAEPR